MYFYISKGAGEYHLDLKFSLLEVIVKLFKYLEPLPKNALKMMID
jgi:hypothetical protein